MRRAVALIVLAWSSWIVAIVGFWFSRYHTISQYSLEHLGEYYTGNAPRAAVQLAVAFVFVIVIAFAFLAARDQASVVADKKLASRPVLSVPDELRVASATEFIGSLWLLLASAIARA